MDGNKKNMDLKHKRVLGNMFYSINNYQMKHYCVYVNNLRLPHGRKKADLVGINFTWGLAVVINNIISGIKISIK